MDITWVLRLIPSYAFGNGILSIGNRNLYARILNIGGGEADATDWDIAGGDLLFLGIFGIVYML